MKRFLMLLILLSASGLTVAQTQDAITIKAKKISDSETPAAVVAAVEQDFPDYTVTDFYVLPATEVNSEWAVTVDDNLGEDEMIDHYTVQLKGAKGGTYYGLYDKDGNRIMSKLKEIDQPLPGAVSKAIVANPKYKGYAIVSDVHYKTIDHQKNKEYWEVTVKKDGKSRKLFYTPEGKLIKEK
jgi:hypothetical protein